MLRLSRTLGICTVIVRLLIGFSTRALGQTGPGGSSVGGELRGTTQIKGEVLCVDCRLEEVRHAQPAEGKLYQVLYPGGQLVLKITWINEPQWWTALISSPELRLRGKASLLQQLSAEENLFREVTVTGLLRATRVFDIYEVKVRSRPTPEVEE